MAKRTTPQSTSAANGAETTPAKPKTKNRSRGRRSVRTEGAASDSPKTTSDKSVKREAPKKTTAPQKRDTPKKTAKETQPRRPAGREGFGASQTPADRERALAKARISTRNAAIVRKRLEDEFTALWTNYQAGESANHPNAVALYSLVGFPWKENEDGELVGDFDFYRSSAARHYDAPDIEWFTDSDETITLHRLLTDDGDAPMLDEQGGDATELIDTPLTDAIREFGLGYKANGTVKRGGLSVRWLLELQPNVSKVKSEAMLIRAGLGERPDILLRSLHSVQYSRLLVACGAERVVAGQPLSEDASSGDTGDEHIEPDEQGDTGNDKTQEMDRIAADLDQAAQDYRDE